MGGKIVVIVVIVHCIGQYTESAYLLYYQVCGKTNVEYMCVIHVILEEVSSVCDLMKWAPKQSLQDSSKSPWGLTNLPLWQLAIVNVSSLGSDLVKDVSSLDRLD